MSVVLVVEDEPIVHPNAAVRLEDEGFDVNEATTLKAWQSLTSLSGRPYRTEAAVARATDWGVQ